jgi:hypothetical protein
VLVAATALAFSPCAPAKPLAATQQANTNDSNQPDISGVWFMHGNLVPALVPAEEAPLLPWGAARLKASKQEIDPELHCFPPGIPRVWVDPAPFEILSLPGRVLIYYEFQHLVRQIHMDRSAHPADLIPTWMGDSIGKWEGDTLVVDSTGFNDKTRLDIAGLPHSDALHVVERIRRASKDQLQVDITVDDPKAYAKPLAGSRIFDLKPGWEIGEWICEENNTYLGASNTSGTEK